MRTGVFKCLTYLLPLLAIVFSFVLIVAQALEAQAWGGTTHRFIVGGAKDVFSDGSFFSVHYSTIYDYCTKPDQWKSIDPYEQYRHWYHVDVPHDESEYWEGVLPWVVEDNFVTLVQRLEDESWENAAQLMGAIGHYTGDATMPLHATSDYNPGGNHGSYEFEVNGRLGEMSIPDYVPLELDNIFDAAMVTLDGSFDFTDEDPEGGVNLSDFLENDILWNDTIKSITENRLRAGVQFTTNLWYTAMIQAELTIQAPTLASPLDGSTITDNTPTFTWTPVNGASFYDFQLASDNDFKSGVLTVKDLSTTSHTLVEPLTSGEWYWRVRSGDNSTHVGLWSQTQWFTVEAALTPPDPIYIKGNDNFTIPDPVNGGGSGTENDPYIIENWVISSENAHGIWIENTTAYFVIRNCVVENGGDPYGYVGIYLYNVVNGRIENCISENNGAGIVLENSSNNILTNNTCENGLFGIDLMSSDNNTLSNNTCSNNQEVAIVLMGTGIHLGGSGNNILTNNTCENNLLGIELGGSDNNTLSNNACGNNPYDGIYLWYSDNNHISNNTCENNGEGIGLWEDSDNNTLSNNTCENNFFGIYLYYSNNNLIYHNNIVNNENLQAYDDGSNYWDNGYPSGGNYWSDYTGADENHGENQDVPEGDGIGDTPYDILGDNNQDRYPLMNPSVAGTAVFSLENLYKVGLDKDLQLYQGSKLVVKFYKYGNIVLQVESVIDIITPPEHVEENENVPHPRKAERYPWGTVQVAKLVLTTDDTAEVISEIASFTVHQSDLKDRFKEILGEWFPHPELHDAFRAEVKDILGQWFPAPP